MTKPAQKLPSFATRMGEIAAPEGDGRRIEISFSSEAPYLRTDWETEEQFWEVLGHAPGEADLTRLNSGAAPLLKDHMPVLDAAIGVVERAWVDGGKGKAMVRFSETPAASDVLARVRAGDVTCVSVGYGIAQAKRDGQKDGHPVVRVTSWLPREISFVAIPADPSVGYGRADQAAQLSTVTVTDNPEPEQESRMEPELNPANPAPAPAQVRNVDPAAAVADALTAERRRVAEIDAIATRFNIAPEQTRSAIDKGVTVDAFRAQVMDGMATPEAEATRAGATMIGLTQREVKAFSILNVVRFLTNPSKENRERAAFEIEASRAAAQVLRRDPEGLFVPPDVLMGAEFLRTQNTGTVGAGGALVGTDHLDGSFIGLLRKKMALTGAGVRVLGGLVGDVDIPKQTGGSTAYWLGEGADGTESDSTFGVVALTPHTVGIATQITRKMLKQSSPDVEALIRADLIASAALAIDQAALVGHASVDAPDGVRDVIVGSAITWAGASAMPTFDEIVQLETLVASQDADFGSLAYIYNAKMAGHLKTTPVFAPESGRAVEQSDGIVNGYNRVKSNQVADGEVFFGNWNDLIIGMWSGLDLRTDTATLAKSDGIVLRAFQDVDVAVRHAESFAMGQP